ncbi:GroES-like protein [Mycena galopus ATCC 62051]|nr:GroES-like protein [Mycena galopus ATCC 62051]
MSVQRAIVIQSPKAPFILSSTAITLPAKGEVLLKIWSAALNPGNWKQREYGFVFDNYPAVLGNDIAGVVEAVGEGVDSFKEGDKVFAQVLFGGFAQYTTVPAAVLIPIPEDVGFDEAATLPVAFTTACVGLFAPAPIGIGLNPTFSWDKPQAGESALVIGGATSVGQFAIQLFKFLGFTRIVAYASKVHFDHLEQLGATECVDRVEVSVDSLAAHLSLSALVKVVFDATGNQNEAYDCVVDGGSVGTVLLTAKQNRDSKKKVVLVPVIGFLAGPDRSAQKMAEARAEMILRVDDDRMQGNRFEVLSNGLAGIVGGLERLQKGSVSGVKLLAHPQDSTA